MVEARRFERVPFVRDGTLVDDHGRRVPFNTTDLSEGGLGIYCSAAYAVGAQVVLQVVVGEGEPPEAVVGLVRFARSEIEGTRMGIGFMRPLSKLEHPRLWGCLERGLARLTRCE